MRELRKGDRVLAREGAKSYFGFHVGSKEGIIEGDFFNSYSYPEYEKVRFVGIVGNKIVNRAYLTRIPKHRSDEPLDETRQRWEKYHENTDGAWAYRNDTNHRAEGEAN